MLITNMYNSYIEVYGDTFKVKERTTPSILIEHTIISATTVIILEKKLAEREGLETMTVRSIVIIRTAAIHTYLLIASIWNCRGS